MRTGTRSRLACLILAATLGMGSPSWAAGGAETPRPAPKIKAVSTKAARTWIALQSEVPINIEKETTLEDVKKSLVAATKSAELPRGLPIHIDPEGLNDADKTMASTVSGLSLEGVPLRTSLKMILRQLDLIYYVQEDGLLIITSKESEGEEVQNVVTAEAARTWIRLQQPVSLDFPKETSIADVFKRIKSATLTKEKGDAGLQVYVDPLALQEADKTMASTVDGIVLQGVPLRTSLKLMLKQLDLTYRVQEDGILMIGSPHEEDEADMEKEKLTGSVTDVLVKIQELQQELGKLHDLVQKASPATAQPSPPGNRQGGMMGGFR